MEEWQPAKNLAKEFGVSEPNLRNMASRKQVRSKSVVIKGKKVKLYSYSDLAKRKGSATTGTRATEESPTDFSRETLRNDTKHLSSIEEFSSGFNLSQEETKRFLSAMMAGKFGSESVLKAEQAIEKMHKNLLDEKHLIDIRNLAQDLDSLFSTIWSQLKEQIDTWQIRYGLTPKQAKEMLADYSRVLEKIRAKSKALVDAQGTP